MAEEISQWHWLANCLEVLQRLAEEQSRHLGAIPERKQWAAEELTDIVIYALHLADPPPRAPAATARSDGAPRNLELMRIPLARHVYLHSL